MYRNLDAYLRDTLYIHQPLPLPEEGRLEEALAQKIPLERRASRPRTRWKAGASWARAN